VGRPRLGKLRSKRCSPGEYDQAVDARATPNAAGLPAQIRARQRNERSTIAIFERVSSSVVQVAARTSDAGGVTQTKWPPINSGRFSSCYKSFAFRRLCKRLGLRHIRTKPYTPKTNGKAERFIQTTLREWAYAQAYQTSGQRKAELPSWLHRYN